MKDEDEDVDRCSRSATHDPFSFILRPLSFVLRLSSFAPDGRRQTGYLA